MLRDLFEKDPCRDIVSVVKVDDHTPEIVWTELEEYVPTEDVKDNFRRIVEGLSKPKAVIQKKYVYGCRAFLDRGKAIF